jgi:hypothetical protein
MSTKNILTTIQNYILDNFNECGVKTQGNTEVIIAGAPHETTQVDEFVELSTFIVDKDRAYLTGDKSTGQEVTGFVRFSIFNATGNNYRGAEIVDILDGLLSETIVQDTAKIRFYGFSLILSGENQDHKKYETVINFPFTSK